MFESIYSLEKINQKKKLMMSWKPTTYEGYIKPRHQTEILAFLMECLLNFYTRCWNLCITLIIICSASIYNYL